MQDPEVQQGQVETPAAPESSSPAVPDPTEARIAALEAKVSEQAGQIADLTEVSKNLLDAITSYSSTSVQVGGKVATLGTSLQLLSATVTDHGTKLAEHESLMNLAKGSFETVHSLAIENDQGLKAVQEHPLVKLNDAQSDAIIATTKQWNPRVFTTT